ncbi:hypothetical protein BATDEDRAFT_90546 [Batrachochytrium dendrobatidis JAM81]|uniref:Uncharacterized protein n=2 Tax=Batrachochytrium dendrobatidis TaxID=109871 RepID=F4P7W3_BATDJ|nr:uncharacterized protein BATDEDRAFT_90546 [Batrachochytrium dendrobatidis JAM81]EGF78734.1 hypothetical protein BATDEDRAFT_90546 [Batrachochytrium dendrobatidis JAM81]OAJ43707.1 hypothetical protein BDEG_27038 [Batrachochytrium dendrobatidis JEL423]|eukprot:XP_006680956.1 hypothetical protein BATDEDRAFT_90546 [Batrachochytrium dendrobatidis JAM81]
MTMSYCSSNQPSRMRHSTHHFNKPSQQPTNSITAHIPYSKLPRQHYRSMMFTKHQHYHPKNYKRNKSNYIHSRTTNVNPNHCSLGHPCPPLWKTHSRTKTCRSCSYAFLPPPLQTPLLNVKPRVVTLQTFNGCAATDAISSDKLQENLVDRRQYELGYGSLLCSNTPDSPPYIPKSIHDCNAEVALDDEIDLAFNDLDLLDSFSPATPYQYGRATNCSTTPSVAAAWLDGG